MGPRPAAVFLSIELCEHGKIAIGCQPEDGSNAEASPLLRHAVIISIGAKRQACDGEGARTIFPRTRQTLRTDGRRGESG